jgi:exonuclease III
VRSRCDREAAAFGARAEQPDALSLSRILSLDTKNVAVICLCYVGNATRTQTGYPTRSWDNDALVQPESRRAYAALLKQRWTDAIRTLHPDVQKYTFLALYAKSLAPDAGLRLDHLLSPLLASRLVHAGVEREFRGREGASDHAPAWVTFVRRQSFRDRRHADLVESLAHAV